MTTSPSDKLAQGLLRTYQPPLKKLENQLKELTSKQAVILSQVENENSKFHQLQPHETMALFNSVKDYHMRLLNVKREMTSLSDRSAKLKKRAMKLKELKEKEAIQEALDRESQINQEEQLVSRPL